MIIRDQDIEILSMTEKLITPFNKEQLQPASYDVAIGDTFIVTTRDGHRIELQDTEPHTFYPGDFILAATLETLNIPTFLACELRLKSTVARIGIGHALAVWIDPGFRGQITMELTIDGNVPIVMQAGDIIAQLIFQPVCKIMDRLTGQLNDLAELSHVQEPYAGRYQDQIGVTEARDGVQGEGRDAPSPYKLKVKSKDST